MGSWVLAASLIFNSQTLLAHYDPPGAAAIHTTIDVKELTIYDGKTSAPNGLGGERSPLNDGPLGVSDWAEILVLVQIDWGGNHGSSYWVWQGEYHFRFVGRDIYHAISGQSQPGSTDFDLLSGLRDANPDSAPVQANIAEHSECTPKAEPTIKVQAFEVDKGDSWAVDLIAAMTGEGLGGGVPGAIIDTIVAQGLSGLNGNDELPVHVGNVPDPKPEFDPFVVIDFNVTSVTFEVTSGCQSQTAYAVPSPTPLPGIPRSLGLLTVPASLPVTSSDDYFTTGRQEILLALADRSASARERARYRSILAFGIDEHHPFGRSPVYASQRFEALRQVLTKLDQSRLEESEKSPLAFASSRQQGRETVVAVAYLVAAQTWSEAVIRGVSDSLTESARQLLLEAATAADRNEAGLALRLYEQVVTRLFSALYPRFDHLPLEPLQPAEWISQGFPGRVANGFSSSPRLSGQGSELVFATDAPNLVSRERNGVAQIFLNKLTEGTLRHVSRSSQGALANAACSSPAVSADGRWIAFSSLASNLHGEDLNGRSDVFLHDALQGTTRCLSRNPQGATGNGHSLEPTLSADGRRVCFASDASDLVAGDGNRARDIFLYDLMSGTLQRVTVNEEGLEANQGSEAPALSGNGRFVAFSSRASNLVANDENGIPDVFIKDLETGHLERCNLSSAGAEVSGSFNQLPQISFDGRYITFSSDAPELAPEFTYHLMQVFRRDRQKGSTTLISLGSDGQPGNGDHLNAALSADGRFAFFSSDSSRLVESDQNSYRDVFRQDRESGQILLISGTDQLSGNGDSGIFGGGVGISTDGQRAAFESQASNLVTTSNTGASQNIVLRDLTTSLFSLGSLSPLPVLARAASRDVALSEQGTIIAYTSTSADLVGGDTNSKSDVFVSGDPSYPGSRLASVALEGQASNGDSREPALSLNGRYLAFVSDGTNLVKNDTNAYSDIFVVDLETGAVQLASFGREGQSANGPSHNPSLSENGRYVTFVSSASNLIEADRNEVDDVFQADLWTRKTVAVSVSDLESVPANGASGEQRLPGVNRMISSSGRFVAFTSAASNLVPGDTNQVEDVFLRDTWSNRTWLVSRAADGTAASSGSSHPSISADGQWVAFTSEAANLVKSDTNAMRDVFLWHQADGRQELVSRASDGRQGDQGSGYGGLSLAPDASAVAFSSLATNFIEGDTNFTDKVFVRYLEMGLTLPAGGADGAGRPLQESRGPSLSRGGQTVAFEARWLPGELGETITYPNIWRSALTPPRRVYFVVSGVSYDPSRRQMKLRWESRTGQQYAIEVSPDLIHWAIQQSGLTHDQGHAGVDVSVGNAPARQLFVRIREQ